MDGGGLEPGPAPDDCFICLLLPIAQDEDGEDARENDQLLSPWCLESEYKQFLLSLKEYSTENVSFQ